MINRTWLPVLLGVVLLSFYALADTDTGWPCTDDLACQQELGDNGDQYYCSPDTGTCFLLDAAPPAPAPTPIVQPVVSATDLTTLEQRVSAVETNIAALQQNLNSIISGNTVTQGDLTSIKNTLDTLQQELNALQQRVSALPQQVDTKINTVSTGLAGLQQDLNETQTQVNSIEQDLVKRKKITRFFTYTFFGLLALAATLGVMYYLNRRSRTIAPEIRNYITQHIQQGKKFPFIRENLRKAGWSSPDIAWAYKETMKHNYQQYAQQRPAAALTTEAKTPDTRTLPPDTKKMWSIGIVTVLLLIGIFFLLSGTVGKAFFVERYRNTSSGEIFDFVKCTPPQITTPTGDACCTDLNNNTVCDATERSVEELAAGQSCTDTLQCGSGESCIDGNCRTLGSLYQGSEICDKMCNYYALRITTSDGEEYNLKPKKGSYTAAGALEWKVLAMPNHCEGEKAVIPFLITRKEPGKIINEEVVTVHEGETTPVLTHPGVPDLSFTLTAKDIRELCS